MVTVSALCDDAVPRRLAGAVADHPSGPGANSGLVAAALVHRQGAAAAVRLRLAAGHAAPAALRPVHAVRLEGPDPGQPGLDPGRWPASGRWQNDDVPRPRPDADRSAACWWSSCWSRCSGRPQAASRAACRCEEQVAARPTGQLPGAADGPAGAAEPAGPARGRRAGSRPPSAADRPATDEGGVTWVRSPARSRASGSPSRTCSEGRHHRLPGEAADAGAALPRPAHPQPAPGRAGEVHRLRAVRLGLPGRRDLRRGRRQHRRAALLARVSGTPASTRSTTPAASSAACASRPARPVR